MTFHHSDENLSFWWTIADMMKFCYFDEHSLLALKCKLMELITLNKNWQLWWKFITLIEFITLMNIHHFDENSSIWWKFIALMKIHNFDENSSLWWKFNTLMEIHNFDENSSLSVKSDHYDEIPMVWWKWKKLLWKWLILINEVIPLIAIHHFDENS